MSLPQSLATLAQYSQFILYRLVGDPTRPGKKSKQPCDYRTGTVTSALNPDNWTSYETAAQCAQQRGQGWGVGFVLTPESHLACVDLDGCLGADGQLSQVAQEAISMLPGAAVERSVSGTGLHIWCSYSELYPHKNRGNGVELYTEKRFIALGTPMSEYEGGGATADCTMGLGGLIGLHLLPDLNTNARGGVVTEQEWTTEPVLEWHGPVDDDELIRRAMQSQSASNAFGGKASFRNLWEGNADALGRAYPDGTSAGRPYDASSVDAALAQHLAFWTGKNCDRIERLMRKSALVRDKWNDHPAYLRELTVIKAVAICDQVCNDKRHVEEAKRRQEQIAENVRIGEGSEFLPLAGEIALEEMLRRFASITNGRQVIDLDNPRRIFSEDDWRASLDASRTLVESEGSKPKSYATTTLWKWSPQRQQVDTVTFRPGYALMTRNPDGVDAVNTWRPFVRTPPTGYPDLFVNHLGYLWGTQVDYVLNWLAHLEQLPGNLPHTGLLHISTSQGTGRNWLASVLCRIWPGHVAANFDLGSSLRDGFNGALSRKLLAVVDEINEGGSSAQWQNAEKLKSMLTTDRREINPKFGRRSVEYNVCRFLIFSNHISALPLTETDRRFHVYRNKLPAMSPEYYKTLYDALKTTEFINSVAQYLRNRDVSNFNPNEHPAMTEAKRDLIAASRSEADDILATLVTVWPVDVISNAALGALVTNFHGGKLTIAHRHALERAGIRKWETPIKIGATTTRVNILRNHEQWENAEPNEIRAELAKSPQLPFGNLRGHLDELMAV